jgi:sugar phosphate permease
VLVATLLGGMVYTAFETVLPVVSVSSFHLPAATWGLLVGINPVLVTLFQVRLTRAIESRGPTAKMCAGVLLMGLPFLLLVASSSLPVIALVIVIFVFGEMVWVPTVQAVVAGWPPSDQLGARMGLFAGTMQLAWMTAPLVSLQLRAARGDEAMWAFFAALAVASMTMGMAALRLGRTSPGGGRAKVAR